MDPSIAPASRAAVVTPNDTAIVGARALYIGTTGDVAIAPRRDMDPVIFKSVPAGTILPVHAAIVALTGTTASNIVAFPEAGHMGRPTKFTQAIADRICERIANRESLRSICRDEEMPAMSSVLSWLADDDKGGFRVKYALAREIQADGFVDEMVEIADDRADDWIEKKNASGETTGWQENGEAIRRSQLRIATRQWVAEKLKPKKYGSKVEPDHGAVTGEVSQLLEDINGKTRGLPNGG